MHQTASSTNSLLQRAIVNLEARPLRDRKNIWMWCVVASALIVVLYFIVPSPYRSASVLLSIVGSFWAFAFYVHRRHAEDTRFAKELLTEFNQRYDELSSDLQLACWREARFEQETKLQFIKYFNLCAEEWLFWSTGYITIRSGAPCAIGLRSSPKTIRSRRIGNGKPKTNTNTGSILKK